MQCSIFQLCFPGIDQFPFSQYKYFPTRCLYSYRSDDSLLIFCPRHRPGVNDNPLQGLHCVPAPLILFICNCKHEVRDVCYRDEIPKVGQVGHEWCAVVSLSLFFCFPFGRSTGTVALLTRFSVGIASQRARCVFGGRAFCSRGLSVLQRAQSFQRLWFPRDFLL